MISKFRVYSLILALFLVFARASFSQDSEVALTVYNENLALVREVRKIQINKGVSEIKFQDVASQIDPTSVYFKSLTAPEKVAILEQNYEYDLVNSSKILSKYLDKPITMLTKENRTYEGSLLNSSGGDIILQDPDGSIKIVNMETVQNMDFPELPEGLITRPTLVWRLNSDQGGEQSIEVGYLTSGIQWHAEYVGIVNKDDTRLNLSGWVSLDNQSGATYKEARLKLVAGTVHRAQPPRRIVYQAREQMMTSAGQQFEEKGFFEYHLYTLQRSATVSDNQIKQISLFAPSEVHVTKTYTFDATASADSKVQVNLEFKNKKEYGLGMPLPQGKVRVYKQDEDASLIFLGEDFVEHTPKDEDLKIYVGDAFDIVAKRTKTDYRRLGENSWEEGWEIELRNHKEQPVQVTVVEHLNLGWEIIRSSPEYKKKDAATIEFLVKVPANGKATVQYVVRYNR